MQDIPDSQSPPRPGSARLPFTQAAAPANLGAGTFDMVKAGDATGAGAAGKSDRKARLAEELRVNLQRRKAQARSRRTGGADVRAATVAAG